MGIIRFLLALSVIVAHSTPIGGISLVGGDRAVQAFYIISGFYMSLILNEKYPHGPGSYRLFMGNRLLRLFPTFLAVLAVTICLQAIFPQSFPGTRNTLAIWRENLGSMSITSILILAASNLLMFGQDMLNLFGFNTTGGNLFFTTDFRKEANPAYLFLFIPPAWSIGVELLFYTVAPFIVRRRWPVILTVLLTSAALRIFLALGFNLRDDPWSYRFFPNELMFFLVGSLGYVFYRHRRQNGGIPRSWGVVLLAASLGIILGYTQIPKLLRVPALYGIIAVSVPIIFSLTRKNRIDRYLGELSYPIYLCHFLLSGILKSFGVNTGICLTLVTVPTAILLAEVVERPVDIFRQRRLEKATSITPKSDLVATAVKSGS